MFVSRYREENFMNSMFLSLSKKDEGLDCWHVNEKWDGGFFAFSTQHKNMYISKNFIYTLLQYLIGEKRFHVPKRNKRLAYANSRTSISRMSEHFTLIIIPLTPHDDRYNKQRKFTTYHIRMNAQHLTDRGCILLIITFIFLDLIDTIINYTRGSS